ncbi:hypothetical protein ACHAXS_009409 [Conticribra weissflogii]
MTLREVWNLKVQFYTILQLQLCQLSTTKIHSHKLHPSKLIDHDHQDILKSDKYEPSNTISTNLYKIKTPGILESGSRQEGDDVCYHGGTIYVDAAFGLIDAVNQVSSVLGSRGDFGWKGAIQAVDLGFAKEYHSDNGICISNNYHEECFKKSQSQNFLELEHLIKTQ